MSDLEREKFEKWTRGEAIPKWPLSRDPQITDKYHNLVAQQLWEAWLARSESAPTRESLHAEWMAQEKYLDWSNFLLHKLTGESAPSDLRRAWEQGRVESARVNCKLCASDRPELILDVKGNHRYKEDGAWYSVCASAEIWKLKWPGESAPATPVYVNESPSREPLDLVAGEAGSPAPAPTEEK